MARGGRALRRRATAPASGPCRAAQAKPNMRRSVSSITATAAPVPCEAEVLQAIASLYKDGLRPYSRIIRKRLVEQTQEAQAELLGEDRGNIVKEGKLRALCGASLQLRVEIEDGGEWSAVFMDREPNFIDIYKTLDDYPQELWTAFEIYLKNLGESNDMVLAGGRYASARALAQCRLPFLEGFSLGQVCHIMQIAISQRKLLGYFNGAIVPYERSTSMVKWRCAQQQRPLVEPRVSASPDGHIPFQVADLATVRLKLREILDSALHRGTDQVALSNIKRLFRALHQLELSETALGHSKLTELLQDPRFSDICTVKLQDRGYVVMPAYPHQTTPLSDNCVALGTIIPQVTPHSDTKEQERLNASNVTPQQQHDCNRQTPVQAKRVSPLKLSSSQLLMIRRALTASNDIGIKKEASDEQLNSLLSVFGHGSLVDSKCSTARVLIGESDSGCDSLRGRDSNISEGGRAVPKEKMPSKQHMVKQQSKDGIQPQDQSLPSAPNGGEDSPQRGAGAELRARLQRRLSKAEGLV